MSLSSGDFIILFLMLLWLQENELYDRFIAPEALGKTCVWKMKVVRWGWRRRQCWIGGGGGGAGAKTLNSE